MTDAEHADFAVLLPDGTVRYEQRRPGQEYYEAIREHIPNTGTQGCGRVRTWYSDTFGPDLPPNPLADQAVARLGYTHPTGWYGVVAVSMEEDSNNQISPLTPEVRDVLDRFARPRA
ncbi:hypothetical protein L3Q65_00160 (plasmid) [Amycolatopsis sp. FU40]|uniref:hypothetical protein n=1 Tax=Amycolatopsis sp. FU40 TaxID=2914159 RepID=UPI001F204F82|nr:hypothetical protein [Amycolatopsis sp. FU40]UKD50712.1 hypothetical protein L3Q65_00160 [Amycolatopsis sp. FU40]